MKIALTFLLVSLLSACGTYQSTTQTDKASYIQLSGNSKGVSIAIDGKQIGTLSDFEPFDLEGTEVTRFEVSTGTHEIEAFRDGITIVKRKIFVAEGNVFEVRLP